MALRAATPAEQGACDFGYRNGLRDGAQCASLQWNAMCDWPIFFANEVTGAYLSTVRVIRKCLEGPTITIYEPEHAPQNDPT